ncbi:hypothetical protein HPG69_016668 [Diceros bicornis minor]|uniref:Uncharacterized protein n=1 Tax=Diceros bicornis minor TaxID=77932 RepID=A0A7J7FNS2_DICBM|nr:hypothetical protein HPG69_016668 [Diceros bicornis minor]
MVKERYYTEHSNEIEYIDDIKDNKRIHVGSLSTGANGAVILPVRGCREDIAAGTKDGATVPCKHQLQDREKFYKENRKREFTDYPMADQKIMVPILKECFLWVSDKGAKNKGGMWSDIESTSLKSKLGSSDPGRGDKTSSVLLREHRWSLWEKGEKLEAVVFCNNYVKILTSIVGLFFGYTCHKNEKIFVVNQAVHKACYFKELISRVQYIQIKASMLSVKYVALKEAEGRPVTSPGNSAVGKSGIRLREACPETAQEKERGMGALSPYKFVIITLLSEAVVTCRISNILPLKDFLSFICGKTRWVSQVIHSYERNKKNISIQRLITLYQMISDYVIIKFTLVFNCLSSRIAYLSSTFQRKRHSEEKYPKAIKQTKKTENPNMRYQRRIQTSALCFKETLLTLPFMKSVQLILSLSSTAATFCHFHSHDIVIVKAIYECLLVAKNKDIVVFLPEKQLISEILWLLAKSLSNR